MDLGEPLAQIYAATNGFVVVVPDEAAEEAAEKEAEKAQKKGNPTPYVPQSERTKQLVFPNIKDAVKFLTKNLPALAKSTKDDFDMAFDEED